MDSFELLRDLSDRFGVAGFEDEVRERVAELVAPHVDEVRVDALGNLIAERRGNGGPRLMLDAHMDEIGFMVSYVEEGGWLRVVPIGGWDERIVPAHALTILADSGEKVRGIVGTIPPHILKQADREKPLPLEDAFVDVGAESQAEVEEMGVRVGSPAVIAYPFERLNGGGGAVAGKALDDRVGCTVLVKTLEALAGEALGVTLFANFAVGEELGLRGARTAAAQIEPDVALALEGTVAADVPGVVPARQPTRLGGGPAITVMDQTIVVSPAVVRALTELAEAEGIPYQYKLPAVGGTDAGAIHLSGRGVLAGVVSVPCRYIHSPFSTLRLDDLEHAIRLTTAFVRRCAEILPQP
ncbi:MAG TPA: M42 family metallopeptidase [Gaiellaceae bacterium]|nr:M42 family metallopeptidase [Gaiellaceae bacterium]